MKVVKAKDGKCCLTQVPVPEVGPREVLIKVYATALNRADTLQAAGKYPPPPGTTDVLGLEASGEIVDVGPQCVNGLKEGDKVMALLAGGGYAEFVAVDERQVMRIPQGYSFKLGAAIPETWLTAFQLLHLVAKINETDTVLIHAAGSGVGTAATQLCRIAGATVIATAGSDEKLEKAKELGASFCFNRKEGAWEEKVLEVTNGKGATVILDCIGYPYVPQNLQAIARDGRWILYGLMGGVKEEKEFQVNLRTILMKRVQLLASTLRARSIEYKADLVTKFITHTSERLKSGENMIIYKIITIVLF
eukprot:CAMPEP_0204822110 /NCGR_PEP_ID=MMETSP1346-20131115/281_1 /ASSEMBLY_ACC=CAM_ASM_000771 /TAXON_ID=215587 /ORGANISM="Aplanochytrium stocchinoi, Strain GSBS06" /LENGTH=305 /DNA_ID=CAMNT_0051948137 /DNA_START=149 /DNA_END=1066 /DNA_ORIENTATION=+